MGTEIQLKTNHEVLVWARESIALSRNEAAKRLNMTNGRLEQLESGNRTPVLTELKQLSKVYKRTIATLLLQNPPKEKSLPKDRRTVNSEQLNVFHEKTILAVRKARALARSLEELKEESGIVTRRFDIKATLNDSPEKLAIELNKQWNIEGLQQLGNANVVLEAFIELIESLGIAVFQQPLTQDGLRGFSLMDEKIPVIVIKRGSEATTAKIFTLFHELGHVILHDVGICDINFDPNAQKIEKWCNSFAGEVLVPANQLFEMEIVQQYIYSNEKSWARKDVFELVNHFHVGPLAILRRLLENDLITKGFYRENHEKWNRPSFGRSKHPEGRNVPKEKLKERGRMFVNLAFDLYDQNKMNLKDLSDYLEVKLSKIPQTRQLLNT